MKKLNIAFIVAVAALCLAACSEQTELRWELQTDSGGAQGASDIRWVPDGSADVIYNTTLNKIGDLTEFQEIDSDSLSGHGSVNLGGTPGEIRLPDGRIHFSLSEGSSETYGISSTAK